MAWAKEHGGDLYQRCQKCGYKSYAIDLRVYTLKFPLPTLKWFDREVFAYRRRAFQTAEFAGEPMAAPPTQGYLCRDCKAGKEVGCEYA